MISSCSRVNARRPSPYITGMLTPKIPIREYASSSILVVSRSDAHEMRRAAGIDWSLTSDRRTSMSMPVTCSMRPGEAHLLHNGVQLAERKTTSRGAISSCKVQPRVNHLLRRNAESGSSGSSASETSSRNAKQTSAFAYHVYMELIASDSSALLVLSMQHVSAHASSYPAASAWMQKLRIFSHACVRGLSGSASAAAPGEE